MADLDFSDVLSSPEFLDTISVFGAVDTIGADGRAVLLSSVTTTYSAIVVPGRADLHRLDDGSRVSAFIEIYLNGTLSIGGRRAGDASERPADIVTWHGSQYVVAMVEDYSAFGEGFIKASCDLIPLNPTVS